MCLLFSLPTPTLAVSTAYSPYSPFSSSSFKSASSSANATCLQALSSLGSLISRTAMSSADANVTPPRLGGVAWHPEPGTVGTSACSPWRETGTLRASASGSTPSGHQW